MITYKQPILLSCWSSHEDYNAGCDVAVVEMTEELIRLTSQRHAVFQQLSEAHTDLVAIQFWDHDLRFFSLGQEPDELEKAVVQMEVSRQSWFHCEQPLSIPEERCQPLDSCWMEVSQHEVQWQAIPAHVGMHVTTAEIELSVLQEISMQLSAPERGR